MFKAKDYKYIFDKVADDSQKFPAEVFALLKDLDLYREGIPRNYKAKNKRKSQDLLDLLFELGRGNLSVARIYEGHINALLLINKFGNAIQKERYFEDAANGKLFGVWNTEMTKDGLLLNNLKLNGAKTFCSGALNIQRPIVTAKTKDGLKMIVLDIEKYPQLEEDWSLWNPIGMRSSVSCRLDFTGISVQEYQFLGEKDDYYKNPYFSWGAVRFSAIQLGGAQAILDAVIDHLQKLKRTSDPFQRRRLGKMSILLQTGKLWIARGNEIENNQIIHCDSEAQVNFANMMRTVTSDICNEIILLAEKAVGIQGIMIGHPLERLVRDLRVYLKQAGPDVALASVGEYTAQKNIASYETAKISKS